MNAVFRTANWLLPLLYLVVLIDYGATFFLRTRTHKRNPLNLAGVPRLRDVCKQRAGHEARGDEQETGEQRVPAHPAAARAAGGTPRIR